MKIKRGLLRLTIVLSIASFLGSLLYKLIFWDWGWHYILSPPDFIHIIAFLLFPWLPWAFYYTVVLWIIRGFKTSNSEDL